MSNVSAKSVDKATFLMGQEALHAAETSVVLGEKTRNSQSTSPGTSFKGASAIKAMETTGTAKTRAALDADRESKGVKAGGGCCVVS